MQVLSAQSVNHAGLQYVALIDNANGSVVQTQRVALTKGTYYYLFENVPAGVYSVYASSRNYGGNKICATAEACGLYIDSNNNDVINVGNSSVTGLNFSTEF